MNPWGSAGSCVCVWWRRGGGHIWRFYTVLLLNAANCSNNGHVKNQDFPVLASQQIYFTILLSSPLEKRWGPSFEHRRMFLAKFGINWPSGSGEKKYKMWKSLQTNRLRDRKQTRGLQLSAQVSFRFKYSQDLRYFYWLVCR